MSKSIVLLVAGTIVSLLVLIGCAHPNNTGQKIAYTTTNFIGSNIDPEMEHKLNWIAEEIQNNDYAIIEIHGHACKKEDQWQEDCELMAKLRAQNVRNYLAEILENDLVLRTPIVVGKSTDNHNADKVFIFLARKPKTAEI